MFNSTPFSPFCSSNVGHPHWCCFCQSPPLFGTSASTEVSCQKCTEEARNIIALAGKLGDDCKKTSSPFVGVANWINRMKGAATDMTKKINVLNENINRMKGAATDMTEKINVLNENINRMKGAATDMNEKINFLNENINCSNEKINFLNESLLAFKQRIHTDIQLKPGCEGPCKPAHRDLLAAKSEIFKNILSSDKFKTLPTPSETITLAELNAEELESFLDFLYFGSLSEEKLEKHACALFAAAHKYEIKYLQEISGRHLLASLSSANALDVLDIADTCSHKLLKDASLSFILKNMENVVFSEKYQSFLVKNPLLCMQITREFVAKKNTN